MLYSKEKYDPIVLEKLQETEMEILDVVVRICNKYGIKYSLAYGTLLGAIRHNGFIPWDDDIDIMMLRSEYNRFVECWYKEPHDGYILVNDDVFSDFTENFTKIRKVGTTFLQFESEKHKKMPLGIFLDIFPLDRLAPEGVKRRIQYNLCLLNMLMTRGYTSKSNGIRQCVERSLLLLPNCCKKIIKGITRKCIRKYNSNTTLKVFDASSLIGLYKIYDSDLLDKTENHVFSGRTYSISTLYQQYLKYRYGDYMELPPEEKRASHYPLQLDFDNDYQNIE